MSRRRAPTLAGLGVAAALAAALSMHARVAHAYTFIEELPDDPCARARSFDPQDTTLTAQKARRACRLEAFEQRLSNERRKTLASDQDERDAWVDKWMGATQSSRVINPLAVEAYAGYGVTSYGLVFSWTVLRQLELAARIGQREMTCADQNGGNGGDCTRTSWNIGARGFLGDRDFAPFVGAGFSSTSAALAIVQPERAGRQPVPPGQRPREQPERVRRLAARGQLPAIEPRVRVRIPDLHGSKFERHAEDTQRGPASHLGGQPEPGPPRRPFPGGLCVLETSCSR